MVSATFSFKCLDDKGPPSPIPIYAGITFQEETHFNDTAVKGATIVDLQADRVNLFDYCNPKLYTPKGIATLLQRYNVRAGDTWVATTTQFVATDDCGVDDTVTKSSVFQVYQPHVMMGLVQGKTHLHYNT